MKQPSFPVLTAEEAAAMIENGQTIGFSGFTPAGGAKAVPAALAERAKAEHAAGRPFKVGVLTGASTGPEIDGALAEAEAISVRAPYQTTPALRKAINAGKVKFFDMHLSMFPQNVRYGFFGPVHWAVVEAADITAGGGVLLTSSVGASPTFLSRAEKVIIELNAHHPAALLGMHDILEPQDPPTRQVIHIHHPSDRIGSPVCVVDPKKIVGIVLTDKPDQGRDLPAETEITRRIGHHITEFLVGELRAGRVPKSFLPLQSGVGGIANSVFAALGASPKIPAFELYTEVLQDSVVPLLENGRVTFASTTALTLGHEMAEYVHSKLDFFRQHILMRPQEISNHPEIARRLGVISMNTAIEVDLFGNVNSSHIMGRQLMNGIGGSGDFTRSAYISIFTCPSTEKDGKISTVVPAVSHTDHSEHSVQVLATEHGVADLRGKDPRQRAEAVIENCADPSYREQLRDYIKFCKPGHEPISAAAFAMHEKFLRDGDMRGVAWNR